MNLMINTYCNFRCPYCFAQTEMKTNTVKNINLENFKTYLDFLKQNDERNVRLIGGEPSLHPQFFELLDIIIAYDCFSSVLVFSNFSFPFEFAQKIVEYSDEIFIEFLPNINNNPQFLPIIERNLDYLSMCIPDAVRRISINIFDPKQDMSFWEDIITKYNIADIRWSITVPNMKLSKDFNFKEYFHSFQPILKEMLTWATKYNVTFSCDCNNPPICAYDEDFISFAMKIDPSFFGSFACDGSALDVTPELDIIGCFGCDKFKHPLAEFETFDEILDLLHMEEDSLRKTPPQKECLSCPRHARTGLYCACLGYRKENNND